MKDNKKNKKAQKSKSPYSSYIFPSIMFSRSSQCPPAESLQQKKFNIKQLGSQTSKQVQEIVDYINRKLCYALHSAYRSISSPHECTLDILQICLHRGKGTVYSLQYLEAYLKLDNNLLEEADLTLNEIMKMVSEQKINNLMILHLQVELAEFMRKAMDYILIGKNFNILFSEQDRYKKYWQSYRNCYSILDDILTRSASSQDKNIFQKQDESRPPADINDLIPFLNLERIRILNFLVKIENNGEFSSKCIEKVHKNWQKLRELQIKAQGTKDYDKVKDMLNNWQLTSRIRSALQLFYEKNKQSNNQSNVVLNLIKIYASPASNILTKYKQNQQMCQIVKYWQAESQQNQLKQQIFVLQYQCSLLIRNALFHVQQLIMESEGNTSSIIHETMSCLDIKIQLCIREMKKILKLEQKQSAQLESPQIRQQNPQELRQFQRNQQKIYRKLRKNFQTQNFLSLCKVFKKINMQENLQFEILKLYQQKFKQVLRSKSISTDAKYFENLIQNEQILSFYFENQVWMEKFSNSPMSKVKIGSRLALSKKNTSYYYGDKLTYEQFKLENSNLQSFIKFWEARDQSRYYRFKIRRYKINLDKWHEEQKHPEQERQKLNQELWNKLKNLEQSSDSGVKKLFPIELIDTSNTNDNELTLILKQYYVPAQERALTIQQCIKKVFTYIQKLIKISEQFVFLKNWYLHFTLYTFEIRNLENEKLVDPEDEKKYVFHAFCDEPILISLLLQSSITLKDKHPSFPFIDFLLLLKAIKTDPRKILNFKFPYQEQQFDHMINEVLAQEMESSNSKSKLMVAKKVREKFQNCPFFWSEEKKILEVLKFKQKILNDKQSEEKRAKKNEQNRQRLGKKQLESFKPKWKNSQIVQENFEEDLSDDERSQVSDLKSRRSRLVQKNIRYRTANQYQKSSQIFSLQEGILQSYAQQINVANKPLGKNGYDWYTGKDEIKARILRLKQNFQFKMVFADHIRSLRNILAHTSDESEKINLELIQKNYPKVIVFLYKYKEYLSKPFGKHAKRKTKTSIQEIIEEKLTQFVGSDDHEANTFAVKQMTKINQKSPSFHTKYGEFQALYSKNNQFLKKYQLCYVCRKIHQNLKDCSSIWQFLRKIKHNNFELVFKYHNNSTSYCIWLESKVMQEKARSLFKKISPIQEITQNWLKQMMNITDYVPTAFLFQLLHYFPNLIDHIRFNRYKWDSKSKLDNYSNTKEKEDKLEQPLKNSISNSKYRKYSQT